MRVGEKLRSPSLTLQARLPYLNPAVGFKMKKKIHPDYREVVFLDAAANFSFLTRSTVKTSQTIQWQDGKTYPLIRLDISSAVAPILHGQDEVGGFDGTNRTVPQEIRRCQEADGKEVKRRRG